MQKYRNRKYNYLSKLAPDLLPVKISPTLLLQAGRTSGYMRYLKAHASDVSKLVRKERDEKNISRFEGPAMFQKRMGKMWAALEPADREVWDNMPTKVEDNADSIFL